MNGQRIVMRQHAMGDVQAAWCVPVIFLRGESTAERPWEETAESPNPS